MKTIHHVVDVNASQDTIWRALTEPDGMSGWWSTSVRTSPPAVGARTFWTFAGDFNPVMEIVTLEPDRELVWRCVDGHQPWHDSVFRFQVHRLHDGRLRLRFWQEYAVELEDDYYGTYNFNWGYYLESLRVFCETGTGKPFPADRGT